MKKFNRNSIIIFYIIFFFCFPSCPSVRKMNWFGTNMPSEKSGITKDFDIILKIKDIFDTKQSGMVVFSFEDCKGVEFRMNLEDKYKTDFKPNEIVKIRSVQKLYVQCHIIFFYRPYIISL
jgi:hypothetical protein